MTAFEWKTFFVWRVTYICVHVTQAQFLPTSSKHVSPGMRFLGLGIRGLSHQSCMSLHIGTNNIVGGSITWLSTDKHIAYKHNRWCKASKLVAPDWTIVWSYFLNRQVKEMIMQKSKLIVLIKSPRYTGGDFMFLYRFLRRRMRRRRRRRPQIPVHWITFEQLFGFLSFLARLLALTCRLPH